MFNFKREKVSHEDIVKDLHEEFKTKNPDVEEEKEEKEEVKTEDLETKEVKSDDEQEESIEQDLGSSPEEIEALELKKEVERLEKEVEEKKKKEEEEETDWQKRNPKVEQRFKKLKWEHETFKEEAEAKVKETLVRLEALEKENERLRRETEGTPETKILNDIEAKDLQRRHRYIEEDKHLPREQRREMTREEYEEWSVDDNSSATDWKVKQALRADKERSRDYDEAVAKTKVDSILRQQQISRLRLEARHPELALDGIKAKLKSEGMDEKQIHDKLYSENQKYKVVFDLIQSDRDFAEKVAFDPKGPEILEKEMIKKLSEIKPNQEISEVEKLKQQIAELQETIGIEKERQERLDEGIVSKKGARVMDKTPQQVQNSAEVDKVISLVNKFAGKNSLTREKYEEASKRNDEIRGTKRYGT